MNRLNCSHLIWKNIAGYNRETDAVSASSLHMEQKIMHRRCWREGERCHKGGYHDELWQEEDSLRFHQELLSPMVMLLVTLHQRDFFPWPMWGYWECCAVQTRPMGFQPSLATMFCNLKNKEIKNSPSNGGFERNETWVYPSPVLTHPY